MQAPYSIFGIGKIQSGGLQHGFAMGGVSVGLRDARFLNPANPASFSTIDYTQLQLGFEYQNINRTFNGNNVVDNNLIVNQINIGIPVINKKKISWGIALGYRPFSKVGYSFTDSTTTIFNTDTLDVKEIYDGNGGLNKVYLGMGFRIYKGLSIGANANFLFGNIEKRSSLEFLESSGYLSSRTTENVKLSYFSFDAGIQYELPFNVFVNKGRNTKDSIYLREVRNYNITFSLAYNYGGSFKATYDKVGLTYLNSLNEIPIDTLDLSQDVSGNITMPHSFGAGVQLRNSNIWMLVADFTYTRWSDFRYFVQPNLRFNDSYGVHLGFSITPNYKSRFVGKNRFFKNIVYSLGARYKSRFLRPGQNSVSTNNSPVDEFAASIGFGFPFGNKKVYGPNGAYYIFSFLNIGIEGGFAKSRFGNSFNSTFIRMNIGVTLKDKWFQQRKFN